MVDIDFFATVDDLGLNDFDFVLFGDGSGTTIELPCAWACHAVNTATKAVTKHFGGLSSGTNNLAELIPYLHALWHIQTSKETRSSTTRVAIVSDSEVTVRCGNGEYERRANAAIWAGIEWFENNGFVILWKHVRRNTNPVNANCDLIAGQKRKLMSEFGK